VFCSGSRESFWFDSSRPFVSLQEDGDDPSSQPS
jgi:hypothetical protein